MQKIVITVFLITVLMTSAFASKVGNMKFTCPISGDEFMAKVQVSGSTFGKNLDLKPTGAIVIPWPIPQCPECHFTFIKDKFSDDEIKKLKKYIRSFKFKRLKHKDVKYYCLAKEYIFLGYDKEVVAQTLLRAVWESNNEEIMKETIAYYETIDEESEFYLTSILLLIEFNRRLGNFEEAFDYCHKIKSHDDYRDYIVKLVAFQEELITKNDTGEHPLP